MKSRLPIRATVAATALPHGMTAPSRVCGHVSWGRSHAQSHRDDRAPEVKEAPDEIVGVFDRRLGQ
jgi:hypothetical protein